MSINLWAVLFAAVANFIIGFLMHGPVAGKMWMRLAGVTPTGNEKFSDMYGQMFWNLMANLVFAYVLAQMINFTGVVGASKGMIFGFWVWLGYVATVSSMGVIWMKQSFKLWVFENFSSLLSILAMGAIIAAW